MEMTVTEEATAEEVVAWLESPEGEAWSRYTHRLLHNEGGIASLKDINLVTFDSPMVAAPDVLAMWMEAWPEITGWTPDDWPENA